MEHFICFRHFDMMDSLLTLPPWSHRYRPASNTRYSRVTLFEMIAYYTRSLGKRNQAGSEYTLYCVQEKRRSHIRFLVHPKREVTPSPM